MYVKCINCKMKGLKSVNYRQIDSYTNKVIHRGAPLLSKNTQP